MSLVDKPTITIYMYKLSANRCSALFPTTAGPYLYKLLRLNKMNSTVSELNVHLNDIYI